MIIEDFKCPICGGPTAHKEQKKTFFKGKKILYSCINPKCRTKLSHDYDEKIKQFMDGIWLYETKCKNSEVWNLYRYKRFNPEQWERILKGERIADLEQKAPNLIPCDSCGKLRGSLIPYVIFENKNYCWICAPIIMDQKTKGITITTTMGIEGHRIREYIDIESIEIVIGTGFFSEFSTEIDDFFGTRSTSFEKKLQAAKKNALRLLKLKALQKGANAIVGIDMDYTEFSGNRIGVVANGTLVKIEPIS